MSKMQKKNKKELVNDGTLLKLLISNISICLKKTHSFTEYFDKISDLYNKTTQKIYNFFESHRQVK